eukprot:SAG31_NODE_316_length_17841_cov_33.716154_3_plen_159_part_00
MSIKNEPDVEEKIVETAEDDGSIEKELPKKKPRSEKQIAAFQKAQHVLKEKRQEAEDLLTEDMLTDPSITNQDPPSTNSIRIFPFFVRLGEADEEYDVRYGRYGHVPPCEHVPQFSDVRRISEASTPVNQSPSVRRIIHPVPEHSLDLRKAASIFERK